MKTFHEKASLCKLPFLKPVSSISYVRNSRFEELLFKKFAFCKLALLETSCFKIYQYRRLAVYEA